MSFIVSSGLQVDSRRYSVSCTAMPDDVSPVSFHVLFSSIFHFELFLLLRIPERIVSHEYFFIFIISAFFFIYNTQEVK